MSFTVNIEDDCEQGELPTTQTAGVATTVDHGHVQIGLVTHYAISNGHGVYYADVSDVPPQRAAYFDIATFSLISVGVS